MIIILRVHKAIMTLLASSSTLCKINPFAIFMYSLNSTKTWRQHRQQFLILYVERGTFSTRAICVTNGVLCVSNDMHIALVQNVPRAYVASKWALQHWTDEHRSSSSLASKTNNNTQQETTDDVEDEESVLDSISLASWHAFLFITTERKIGRAIIQYDLMDRSHRFNITGMKDEMRTIIDHGSSNLPSIRMRERER